MRTTDWDDAVDTAWSHAKKWGKTPYPSRQQVEDVIEALVAQGYLSFEEY